MDKLENEVYDSVSLTSLTRSEILTLLERVVARVKAVPVKIAYPRIK